MQISVLVINLLVGNLKKFCRSPVNNWHVRGSETRCCNCQLFLHSFTLLSVPCTLPPLPPHSNDKVLLGLGLESVMLKNMPALEGQRIFCGVHWKLHPSLILAASAAFYCTTVSVPKENWSSPVPVHRFPSTASWQRREGRWVVAEGVSFVFTPSSSSIMSASQWKHFRDIPPTSVSGIPWSRLRTTILSAVSC